MNSLVSAGTWRNSAKSGDRPRNGLGAGAAAWNGDCTAGASRSPAPARFDDRYPNPTAGFATAAGEPRFYPAASRNTVGVAAGGCRQIAAKSPMILRFAFAFLPAIGHPAPKDTNHWGASWANTTSSVFLPRRSRCRAAWIRATRAMPRSAPVSAPSARPSRMATRSRARCWGPRPVRCATTWASATDLTSETAARRIARAVFFDRPSGQCAPVAFVLRRAGARPPGAGLK